MEINSPHGCNIQMLVLLVGFVVLFTFFSFGIDTMQDSSSQPTPTQIGFAPSETFNPSLVTIVEPPEIDAPFAVLDNQLLYGYSETINCQYVIAGEVFDLNGDPLTEDIAVVLDMIELQEIEGDDEARQLSYSYPGDDVERGASGWAAVVVNWDVDYWVWLTRISTGEVISPKVLVQTQDCENNLAVVNFVQVAPLN
jgi:hypothetical protein